MSGVEGATPRYGTDGAAGARNLGIEGRHGQRGDVLDDGALWPWWAAIERVRVCVPMIVLRAFTVSESGPQSCPLSAMSVTFDRLHDVLRDEV